MVAYIEAGRLLETTVPIPFLLLFAVMVLAASLGGTRGGVASAVVVAAYIIYAAATAFGPPTLTGGPVQVALGIVLIGATALVLGRIRDQNTRLLQAELQGRSRLEQEVAERKQAEAALRKAHDELEERVAERTAELRESEARWRLLVEHHPETLQVSVDGILVYINRAGVDLFGAASAKEMIGRSLFDFAAPDVHDALHARRAVLAQGEATDPLEHEILRLGGEVRIVESFSIPILYQGKPAAQTVLRDVTARRRAEEMLRASERVLWSTLDGLAASIVLLDDQGHILLVNKPWRTFAQDNGADPDAVSVGVNYLEVCDAATGEDAEDARRFAEGIRAVLAGERFAFAMEYACHSPDRQRWMIGRVTPYADDDPRRAVVAHENITTRKQAEAARQQTLTLLRGFMDHSPSLIFIKDAEGRFLDVNLKAEEAWGVRRADILGKTDYDLPGFLAARADTFVADDRQVLTSVQPLKYEDEISIQGDVYTYLVEKFPLVDAEGVPYAVCGISTDITARKQAEAALRESEAQVQAQLDELEHIYKTAPVGLCLMDTDLRFVRINALLAEINGKPIAEHRDKRLHAVIPEIAEHVAPIYRRVIDTGEPALNFEVHGTTAANPEAPRDWLVSYYPYRAEDGTIQGVSTVVQDITSRKKVEEALRESEERYRALFEEASAARQRLEHLSRRLVEVQERERRQIALELHDEIGQLLTALNLMLETINPSEPQTIAGRLGQAQAVLDELMTKVRDLSLDLRPAMLDDFGLLPTLQWYTTRYTAQTQIRVHLQHEGLAEQRFSAEVETTAYRIIQEALTNVARYAEVAEAAVRVWTADDQLHVQIEDNGAGFDVAQVLKGAATGGLSGLHERAALLNGTVTISSKPGQGTRIDVILPG